MTKRWSKKGMTPAERAARIGLAGLARDSQSLATIEARVVEAIEAAIADEREKIDAALDMRNCPPTLWATFRRLSKELGLP